MTAYKLPSSAFKPMMFEKHFLMIGVQGITVTEVKGFGRQKKATTELYRGAGICSGLLPKLKIELAIADDMTDQALRPFTGAANTGKIGDA